MSATLYWHQGGACGGDLWSVTGIESPNLLELADRLDLDVLWAPAFSSHSPTEHRALLDALLAGEQALDILCVEGSVVCGPDGTGAFDTYAGTPKRDLVAGLARRARYVIAVGTCASFGGIGAGAEIEATGLQFTKRKRGGLLGADFVSAAGLPVVNLPGCPCHGEVLAGALTMLVSCGGCLMLNEHQSPLEWYGLLVHQGCVRDEYHEYRIEERDFGENGCLFFYMGCRGPLAFGPCNKLLWNRRSSKTRVGTPCFGCTEPEFPRPYPFFETRAVAEVPLELPAGVDRAHYLAYKDMAAAAAPQRLRRRETRV